MNLGNYALFAADTRVSYYPNGVEPEIALGVSN